MAYFVTNFCAGRACKTEFANDTLDGAAGEQSGADSICSETEKNICCSSIEYLCTTPKSEMNYSTIRSVL